MTGAGPEGRIRLRHLAADVLGLPPGGGELLANRPNPRPGLHIPRTLADLDGPPRESPFLEREELASAIREQYAEAAVRTELHPEQESALLRLEDPRSEVVICGQQPGFLGGPLLCLHKAIQTIALARDLERHRGTPVVPIYWSHSDDHDLAEVNHVHLLNRNLDLARIGLPGMGSGRRPLYDLPLDAGEQRLATVRAHLVQVLPNGPLREDLLSAFFPADGETLGEAFRRGWTRLLGHTGLLVLEPRGIRSALSRALAVWVQRELEAVLPPPLAGEPPPAWAFKHTERGRIAVRWIDGALRLDGHPGTLEKAELAASMVQDPEAWSPAARLRPLVQDDCLPIRAYIGGWGELEYRLPLFELQARHTRQAPWWVPRRSVTLLGPAARGALERLHLDLGDFLRSGGSLDSNRGMVEPQAARLLRNEAEASAERMRLLQAELTELDRGLGIQLKRAVRDASKLYERLARKAERADANRRGKSRRHVRRLTNTLFGHGQPQERVLTTLQYAIAFGTRWIDALIDESHPLDLEHLVVELPEGLEGAE
jgi:bacillithiol biosynthesis cysteine-adding enzyme BshC